MKFFKKSAISMAMTTALLTGGMLATQQASAAALAPLAANAPYVSVNGLGQALVYPYYTVRDGFKTAFNVFNTSDTHAVAVKVRFREYQNSRDVLDFNLVLSPNDKWSGNVLESATSGAVLITGDSSCTAPAIPAAGAPFIDTGYTFVGSADDGTESLNFQDSGDQDLERLKSGYIEIIPMAWSHYNVDDSSTDAVEGVFAGALHGQESGTPADCGVVRSSFVATTSWTPPALGAAVGAAPGTGAPAISTATLSAADIALLPAGTLDDAGGALVADTTVRWSAIPDGSNPLFGELALINVDGGVAGGTNAVALADWMSGASLLTAQGFPYFLEPTLATAKGVWDLDELHLTDYALLASGIANEWANNSDNNAQVSWAVTMPTKSFHVDSDLADLTVGSEALGNIQAGVNDWRTYVAGVATLVPTPVAGNTGILAPFENVFASGVSESTVDISLYGSEEGEASDVAGDVSFSPGSFSTLLPTLKYEANTISFAGTTEDDVLKGVLPLDLDPVTDVAGGKYSGHLRLGLAGAAAGISFDSGVTRLTGLPLAGFAMKDRDTGNSALSFGQILDHKFMGPDQL